MPNEINPDASRIWDGAETYVIPRSAVVGGDISAYIPANVDEELDPLWEFVGLLDASAGIPVNPEIEITHYDGFGHPRYRSKARKGAISTGFTALEDNSVTRKFVLPGSSPNKIGAPKGVYFYVAYVLRDEDIVTDIRITLRPALFELTGHSGAVEGEQESYEIACHHANDANGDVFQRVETSSVEPTVKTFTLPAGTTGGTWTVAVDTKATGPLASSITRAQFESALEALSTVGEGNVTVTGTGGLTGYTATIYVPVTTVTATGTSLTPSGTVAVS
ncbi:hypothetical protein L1080_004370 [Rhodococcus sp. MSC1_016]|jgi:hypothetical protein|uniref:hypothetical protein n=1 Tax=Rhodococcus sp. MSC1_016 TaxID=2909266 RepID=UPI00202E827C|nr:hypothetical protein [Rhodococcus sp. MSC1_016]